MVIVQLADGMLSIGGVSRFIYNLTLKLEKQTNRAISAVYELEENNNWGEQPLNIIKLDDNNETSYKKISGCNPDLIVWHVSIRTIGLVRELSKKYPVLAIVHSIPCPSGTRLFRDKDEICYITSGAKCLQNWYTRRCGTNPSPTKAVKSLLVHKTMMNTLKSCNWVYTISKSMKSYLMQEGIREEQITIFDVSLGSVLELPKEINIVEKNNDDPIHILFMGRLSYNKGVQYLIKAVKILLDEGMKVTCTIAGRGWFESKLVQLTEELNLSHAIAFIGSVPGTDVGKWYEAADVIVVPSILPEPAGLVVPEARSYGKPVVVFNVGGLAEWNEYITGISNAEAPDPYSLARTIKQTMKKEEVPQVKMNYADERVDIVDQIGKVLISNQAVK